jgi:hypothetical protein
VHVQHEIIDFRRMGGGHVRHVAAVTYTIVEFTYSYILDQSSNCSLHALLLTTYVCQPHTYVSYDIPQSYRYLYVMRAAACPEYSVYADCAGSTDKDQLAIPSADVKLHVTIVGSSCARTL